MERLVKKVIVFGAGKIGKKLIKELKQIEDILIEGVFDNGENVSVDGYSMLDITEKKYADISVIIAMNDIHNVEQAYEQLKKLDYKEIYWYSGNHGIPNEQFENIRLLPMENWGDCILPSVEMHVMDCCNLNCRGCSHFSPIYPRDIPDLEVRCKDIEKLKSIFLYIARFYILGGEPFLHPQLEQYIYKIRKMLPETEINIVTNGLLIPRVDAGILESIRNNNIIVEISGYEPTYKMIQNITARLEAFNIQYWVGKLALRKRFNKPLSLIENSKYKQKCISDGCISIYEGKISRCPTLMYINQFNKVFNTNLPDEGIINLDDINNGRELLNILKQEVPLCKHCVENEIDWSPCGNPIEISDFAVND